jgi:hypothetical protein
MPIEIRELLIKGNMNREDMSPQKENELPKDLENNIHQILDAYKTEIIKECTEKMRELLKQQRKR